RAVEDVRLFDRGALAFAGPGGVLDGPDRTPRGARRGTRGARFDLELDRAAERDRGGRSRASGEARLTASRYVFSRAFPGSRNRLCGADVSVWDLPSLARADFQAERHASPPSALPRVPDGSARAGDRARAGRFATTCRIAFS